MVPGCTILRRIILVYKYYTVTMPIPEKYHE